jgi:hypothetical protein
LFSSSPGSSPSFHSPHSTHRHHSVLIVRGRTRTYTQAHRHTHTHTHLSSSSLYLTRIHHDSSQSLFSSLLCSSLLGGHHHHPRKETTSSSGLPGLKQLCCLRCVRLGFGAHAGTTFALTRRRGRRRLSSSSTLLSFEDRSEARSGSGARVLWRGEGVGESGGLAVWLAGWRAAGGFGRCCSGLKRAGAAGEGRRVRFMV